MTHYIKFQYTRWDRWKRLTREFIIDSLETFKFFIRIFIFYIFLCLGWLGFLGSDPKFFPHGGLIQKCARKIGKKIFTWRK